MALTPTVKPQSEDEEEVIAEINITPLTDIFLVLLIIFMVTSTALTQKGMAVQVPEAKNSTSLAAKKQLVVTLSKDGSVLMNNHPVDLNEIEKEFDRQIEKNSETTIIMEGDQEALLGSVVRILDAAKEAGAAHIAIAAKPLPENALKRSD